MHIIQTNFSYKSLLLNLHLRLHCTKRN